MRLLYNVNSVQNKMKLENLVGEFFTHIGMSFFFCSILPLIKLQNNLISNKPHRGDVALILYFS